MPNVENLEKFYSYLKKAKHIKSNHIALYVHFILRNEIGIWFDSDFRLDMKLSGISTTRTYYKTLDDLMNFSLLDIAKGNNQHSRTRIKLNPISKNTKIIVDSKPKLKPSKIMDYEELNRKLNYPKGTDNALPPSDKAKELCNQICEYFDIHPHHQFKHMTAILAFVSKMEKTARLDYLREQFEGYKKVKDIDQGKYRHSWTRYIGTPSEAYEDGGWNIKNWKAESQKLGLAPEKKASNSFLSKFKNQSEILKEQKQREGN